MKKIKTIILFILFNALLFVTLLSMNFVFRNKEYEGAQDKFAGWNPEHADIVFIGTSHQFCTIDPDLLYNEYGIESFMLATSAQTVPMSYYAAMEAIELKHPDTIVFEISYVANDFRTLAGMDHCFFDGFPRCNARKEALNDLVDKDQQIYYLLPLGMFHSRWKELDEEDFMDFPVSDRGTFFNAQVFRGGEIPIQDPSVSEPIPGEMEKYLLMLFDLCEENNVELILYAAPFNGLYLYDENCTADLLLRESMFNYTGQLCEERGIEFHNLFYELDAIGINDETDWMDSQHFNCLGQAKLTRYMMDNGYLGH